jgi:hypothetical protein
MPPVLTHEGARAYPHLTPEQALRRSLLSCLLWENEFYEDGISIADRIMQNAAACDAEVVSALAIEARRQHGLRHAPLLLLLDLIKRGGSGVAGTIVSTMKRADDMTELLSLYWKFNPGKGLSKQLKVGLARAFTNFDEYQLAKYDREGAVRLRDVLFQSHAKPADEAQAALFKRVTDRALATPDTWETELSAGANKKETFERLIREGRLGYLALLRNLRNMADAGCDTELVKNAILARKGADMVFPFRFLTAARSAPQFDGVLGEALLAKIDTLPKLPGKTVVCVDVSGSMGAVVSQKSVVTRAEAGATLASMVNGDTRLVAFASGVKEVPARRGLAGVDAIRTVQSTIGMGTNIGEAVQMANAMKPDRIIVVTDEQSHDPVGQPQCEHAYMINVASYKNGVGYGRWTHLDGFSEAVIRYISEIEGRAAA